MLDMTNDYAQNMAIFNRAGRQTVDELFAKHGITLEQIAKITVDLQQRFLPNISVEKVVPVINNMLNKDEVQDVIILGFTLDDLAERDLLPEPLLTKVRRDEGSFGIDELLVSGIYSLYGTISVTNFGYADRIKSGLIGEIDAKGKASFDVSTTFQDDIIGALATGACGYFAHNPQTLVE